MQFSALRQRESRDFPSGRSRFLRQTARAAARPLPMGDSSYLFCSLPVGSDARLLPRAGRRCECHHGRLRTCASRVYHPVTCSISLLERVYSTLPLSVKIRRYRFPTHAPKVGARMTTWTFTLPSSMKGVSSGGRQTRHRIET